MKKIFIFCTSLIVSVAAQNNPSIDSTLKEVELLYNSAQYVAAELEARRLYEEPTITDSTKIEIEKWIAFSLIAQGKPSSARERFVSMLSLNPDFELDPVLTSPKILTVFNDAKVKYLSQRKSLPDTITSGWQFISPPTFRTIIFPGWEQLHQNRTSSGAVFISAGIATLGTGIACELLRSDAREKYLKASIPTDIASKYNTYNNYRKAEIYSFIAFAVVYVASEIDVIAHTESSPITSLNSFPQSILTFSIRF